MGVRPQRAGGRAFASPFGDLRAVATRRKGRLRARVEHRFTDTAVTTRWRLTGRPRGARAEVLFPSHGPGARVTAVLADGREIALEGELRVRDVEYFRVRSALAAYRVRLLDVPRGATARTTSPRPQPGEPDPGPSLVIATGPPPVALEARLFVEARP
jgi:hypothetical protein